MATWYDDTPEAKRLLAEELALVDAAELVSAALERRGRTRAWLARALGVRPSEITQRLSGKRNVTLRSLAAMLNELDCELELDARDRATSDTLSERPARVSRKTLDLDWKATQVTITFDDRDVDVLKILSEAHMRQGHLRAATIYHRKEKDWHEVDVDPWSTVEAAV